MTVTNNNWLLKAGISVAAVVIALIHVLYPDLNIDAITVTLLLVALVPWLSSIFKSLEFPGGWKVEFQEVKEQVQSMIAKEAEPLSKPGLTVRAFSVNDDGTRSVIKALGNPKYTWRYVGGLKEETGLSSEKVQSALDWLMKNGLITESMHRNESLWALSPDGRDLLEAVRRESP